ncbi:MAG: ABC transporter ATP-binding protein [Oligoflexia bacterium]|nr:ABC transporter ATP-binding protein [Oligoflexia bacterium]
MNDFILETNEVSYSYSDKILALDKVTVQFSKGKRHVILGSNGAGKSTLFMLLNGLFRPSSGNIIFKGKPITYNSKALREIRTSIGVLFQDPDSQLISASVREDISFGPMNLKLDKKTVKERVDYALEITGTNNLADRPVHSLSYGQKKSVCIAGIMAMKPEILILDEPCAGLDQLANQRFLSLLEKLMIQEELTIIFSTHDIDLAYRWADDMYLFNDGKVVASCSSSNFADEFPKFSDYGFVPPQLIELYQHLKEVGVISQRDQHPRSLSELIQLIESSSSYALSNHLKLLSDLIER